MSHFPKPFWRADRQRWMLQLRPGKILTLSANRDEAFRKYHSIMADAEKGQSHSPPPSIEVNGDSPVAVLLDQFIDWVAKNRKKATYETYRDRLQRFVSSLDDPTLTVSRLKPYHVTKFVDKHPKWSASMRRGRMQAVQTALNWAVREGLIDRSPIAKLQKTIGGPAR